MSLQSSRHYAFVFTPKEMDHRPRKVKGEWAFNRIDTKTCSGHFDEVNCVAFSNDLEMMVTGSDDSNVRVFNAVSNRLITCLLGHTGSIQAVGISPNNQVIASGSHDKSIRLWKTRDATCLHVLCGHTKSVECLSFSNDSSLICSGSWDKTAILWSIQDGTICNIYAEHKDLVQSTAFSYDGSYLATGSWDYTVQVWRLRKERQHWQSVSQVDSNLTKIDQLHILSGHVGNIHAVAFSKEGMLASGSWDKTIRLWNPRNGSCLFTLDGHSGWVQCLSFSFDSLFLISASDDDSVRIWSCATGKCIKQLEQTGTDTVAHCSFGQGTHDVIVVSGSAAFMHYDEVE